MSSLLVVHHTVSPATAEILDAVKAGLDEPELAQVQVTYRAALAAGPAETMAADAILLISPVNIGYLSGALKHYFDGIYYPCLEEAVGRPFGAILHSGSDASGALRALGAITGGLQWTAVADTLVVEGSPDASTRASIGDLAATLAAHAADLL